jgi:hypothetical protein
MSKPNSETIKKVRQALDKVNGTKQHNNTKKINPTVQRVG